MKKTIFVLLLILCAIVCAILKQNKVEENSEKNTEVISSFEENSEKMIIKEKGELNTNALYSVDGQISNAETDLQAIDMTWNDNCALYHKIITNEDDYDKFSERIELPEVNFNENFLIIVSSENLKPANEVDLTVYDVTADETTTHIIMKQKENPIIYSSLPSGVTSSGRVYYSDNNVFWAVVDNYVLKENINVVIEHE